MPVGRCVIRTAESVVLTLWPPGPDERYTSIFRSLGSMSTSTSSASGSTDTVAEDVCTRPLASVTGTRWTRCTPASCSSRVQASSPLHQVGRLVEAALLGLRAPRRPRTSSRAGRRSARYISARSRREEVGLLAALGAADLEDDVAALVGVARQQQGLEGHLELGDRGLGASSSRRATARGRRRCVSLNISLARCRGRRARPSSAFQALLISASSLWRRDRSRRRVRSLGDVRLGERRLDGAQLVLTRTSSVSSRERTKGGGRLEGLRLRSARLGLLGVAALEALDAATGVDELLLAGEEGVALVAQLDASWLTWSTGGERVAARAGDGRVAVGGVDLGLHECSLSRSREFTGKSAGGIRALGDLGQELVVRAGRLELVDQQLESRRPRGPRRPGRSGPGAASRPGAAPRG